MIFGFAMNRNGENGMRLFQEMQNARTRPDDVTFISILTTCSCLGIVMHEGLKLLNIMWNTYSIQPMDV